MRGVAISGKAGAGKTTLAGHLLSQMRLRGWSGAARVAFGDALKREVKQLYGVEKGDPLGRVLLIGHGEARRDADPLYWIRQVVKTLDWMQPDFVIIDDLRFPTELAWALGLGLLTVRIEAPASVRAARISAVGGDVTIVGSSSRTETSLDSCLVDFDVVVQNDEGTDLDDEARGVAAHFGFRPRHLAA